MGLDRPLPLRRASPASACRGRGQGHDGVADVTRGPAATEVAREQARDRRRGDRSQHAVRLTTAVLGIALAAPAIPLPAMAGAEPRRGGAVPTAEVGG